MPNHFYWEGMQMNTYNRLRTARRHFSVSLLVVAFGLLVSLRCFAESNKSDIPTDEKSVLAIGSDIKSILDTEIRPLKRKTTQVAALHDLLFGTFHLGLKYDNSYTKTAQEVYTSGSGNCLSLAALYVASARYLGLNAKFQMVAIPNQWDRRNSLNMVMGHVNARVDLPEHDATIEFSNIYTAVEIKKFKSRIISDKEAIALYFSNRGGELAAAGQPQHAVNYLAKSIDIYRKNTQAWTNLGVTHKLLGNFAEAENAYINAQKVDGQNISAMNNLYHLYLETQQTQKAMPLAKKIRNHQLKNPYFLADLAQQRFNHGDFIGSINFIKRAIKIQTEESDFYLLLGKALYSAGQHAESELALKKSIALTLDPNQLVQRQKKLIALQSLYAQ
jgi:Flp pilus assembly protein TadD